MKETLEDIREKLQAGAYRNEEHVRLNLVVRILQQLDWDIWNPSEVYPEFLVAPTEDSTKVDLALCVNRVRLYIEIKKVGHVADDLQATERQLRDYNRNNTALFTLITDGRNWRFYYSQTGGEFSQKCFNIIDLIDDDIADAARNFDKFLNKQRIDSGDAKQAAEHYLQLSQRQRAMEDSLSEARRLINEPPFPSLPECVRNLVERAGFTITLEEARIYAESSAHRPATAHVARTLVAATPLLAGDVQRFNLDNLPSVQFSVVQEGRFGEVTATNWKPLLEAALREAHRRGHPFEQIRTLLTANLRIGSHTLQGFNPVPGTNFSMQGLNANNSLHNTAILAKRMQVRFFVRLSWREGPNAGQEGVIEHIP